MRTLRRLFVFLVVLGLLYGVWWFVAEQHRRETAQTRYETYGRELGSPMEGEHFSASDLAPGNDTARPNKTELLFLLAGVDDDGASGTRTDTLMLVKLNWRDGSLQLLSIPRDSYVYVQDSPDKINHAHAYGGMELTLKTVRETLGIDVDYFVKMDMDAVMEVIDIIGGVEVTVEEPQASDLGLQEGPQTLDGYQALQYLQYRKGFSDGDLGRVSSQQGFLKTVIPQILSPKNLVHFPTLLTTSQKYMDTNIGPLTMASMVPSLFTIRGEGMTTATLPGEAGELDGISYYFLWPNTLQELVDTYLSAYREHEVIVP